MSRGINGMSMVQFTAQRSLFKRFKYKFNDEAAEMKIKEIRISIEDGPDYKDSEYYLNVWSADSNDDEGLIYYKLMKPFMAEHIVPQVHDYIIYNMHRWGKPFQKWLRQHGHFPVNEIPYAVGDYFEHRGNIFYVTWNPTTDGRIYLTDSYKDKIDICGAKKIDIAETDKTKSVQYESNKTKYYSLSSCENVLLLHHGRIRSRELIERILNVSKLRDVFETAFINSARALTWNRIGGNYSRVYRIALFALKHIKDKYKLIAKKRTKANLYEYILSMEPNDMFELFGFNYWRRKLDSKNIAFVDSITLQFSLISKKLLVEGIIKRQDEDGDIFS
eukprot:396687_1